MTEMRSGSSIKQKILKRSDGYSISVIALYCAARRPEFGKAVCGFLPRGNNSVRLMYMYERERERSREPLRAPIKRILSHLARLKYIYESYRQIWARVESIFPRDCPRDASE